MSNQKERVQTNIMQFHTESDCKRNKENRKAPGPSTGTT